MTLRTKIGISLAIFLLLIILSKVFIKHDVAPIAGENQYTFSYAGQIHWILDDWKENPSLLLKSHQCNDCQHFGMYSRWVMLWLYLLLLPSDIFGMNPLIWYIAISFVMQYIGIKYFLTSLFNKDKWNDIVFLLLTIFFVTIPYKYYQFTIQWEYPVIYSLFFIFIGSAIRFIRKGYLNRNELIITTIYSFFIFNIGINHLPILVYLLAILLGYALYKYWPKKNKLIKQYTVIFSPSLIFNMPMILSLFTNSDITTHTVFFSPSWLSILSLGYFGEPSTKQWILMWIVIGTSFLITAYLINPKEVWKKVMIIVLAGISLSFIGREILFQYIFEYVPLFHTLRSAYRFIMFAHIALVAAVGIIIIRAKTLKQRALVYYLILSAIILNSVYIYNHATMLNMTPIPVDYRLVYNDLKNDNANRYIYFPSQLNVNHYISIDYAYGNSEGPFHWWSKPFEAWFPLRNTHLPTHGITNDDLNTKIYELYSQNKQNEVITLLKKSGVSCIIVDGYYKWNDEMPLFELKTFIQRSDLSLQKKYKEISIYCIK